MLAPIFFMPRENWIAPRQLPFKVRDRYVMVQVDRRGLYLWAKGRHEKRSINWSELIEKVLMERPYYDPEVEPGTGKPLHHRKLR